MASSRELIIGIRTKDASKASKDIKDVDKSIKGAEKSTVICGSRYLKSNCR